MQLRAAGMSRSAQPKINERPNQLSHFESFPTSRVVPELSESSEKTLRIKAT
jgi:hypothetical protein